MKYNPYTKYKELRAKYSLEDLVLIFTRKKAMIYELMMSNEA